MRLTRRGLLGLAGGTALAAGGSVALGSRSPVTDAVPFFGEHQSGITTPVQDRLHLAALDVSDPLGLPALLGRWTEAAARMCSGLPVGDGGGGGEVPAAPPRDTGEAVGLPASRLTVTLGIGGGLLDRLGVARPPGLVDLPHFPGDALRPELSGGDLLLQACADDPQVAVHAVRNLVRLAAGTAAVRWSQLGFGRTSSTTSDPHTPRNLFGFKDGTRNDSSDVWVTDGPDWMVGGSYLVHRRIAMTVETWDRTSLAEQEAVVGRHKATGAPLGRAHEHDEVEPAALPATAHVRLARPERNGGARMLRRGYSYVDGSDGLGHLDAGLVFLAYQSDVRTGFLPVQRTLARSDAMNEYVRHTGSSVWAVPPGVRRGGSWADALVTLATR